MQDRDDIRDIRPNPDPTRLGSAQLFREIGNLEKIFETKLQVVERHLEATDRRVGLAMFLNTTTLLILAVVLAVAATVGLVAVLGA